MFTEATFALPGGITKTVKFQKNGYPLNSWRASPRKMPEIVQEILKFSKNNQKPKEEFVPLDSIVDLPSSDFIFNIPSKNIDWDYFEWEFPEMYINLEK